MLKRRLALVLAITIALTTALVGCGGGSSSSSSSSSAESTASTESKTEDGGREMEGNMYVKDLPIVKEQESFRFLIDSGEDPNKMELFQRFEKETNVKVEWMAYPYDVAAEKKNLMYTSGDYPDAVGGWLLGSDDIMKYGMNEDVFIPIEDYIAKYAPRITKVFDEYPGARQTVTTPDNHIYTIPLMAPQPGTRYVMLMNKTWLKNVGMTMPKTTDDLYNVLKAFKEKDPNGNNKADELPLTVMKEGIGDLFGWFGLPDQAKNHIQIKDGKPFFTADTEEFKQAILYFNKLFTEGLIDPEAFTQDGTQYSAKGKETDEVYGVFHDWHGVNIVGIDRYKADYEPMPVLASPNCAEPTWGQGDNSIFKTQFAITSAAKNPATIVRWYDYVYDEDNSIQVFRGPYGQLIDRKEDGSFETLEPPAGETLDSYRGKISVPCMPYAIMPAINDMFALDEAGIIKKGIDELYAPNIVKEPTPSYWMTPDETTSIATISTDLYKYIADQKVAWITGQADINADWDAYLAQLKTLGVDKYKEVKFAAVQRALDVK